MMDLNSLTHYLVFKHLSSYSIGCSLQTFTVSSCRQNFSLYVLNGINQESVLWAGADCDLF